MGSDSCYLYIKGIKAQDGCVYLECNEPGNGQVYLNAQVLVHMLSKMDPSSVLKISWGYGDDGLINIDGSSFEYDRENEICIYMPMENEEEWEDEEEDE